MFWKTARIKVWFLIAFFVLGVVLGIFLVAFALEPKSVIKSLVFSNITDHQITISWVTEKETKGVVVVSQGKLPVWPIFVKNYSKDDGEKSLKKVGRYITHHVTITNLNPDNKYKFKIFQGLKTAFNGEFRTFKTLDSLDGPNPIYGRVLSKDKRPVIGAIIYLQAKTASQSSSLISSQTNLTGRWSLDLANLRTSNLDEGFDLKSNTLEIVIVETGKGKVKAETKQGQDKPWPDIII